MTDLRTVARQALRALERADKISGYANNKKVITALRAALAQQAEPDAYGYASRLAVAIWEKHYKDTAPQWKPLDDLMGVLTQIDNMAAGMTRLAQQAEPVEPVEPVRQPYCYVYEYDGVFGLHREFYPLPYNGMKPSRTVPVYTVPPQRKPLPKHDQHCVDVPGYGLMAVRLVRAVERAHGITDPQIADHLARYGIPMPEGDPK